MGTSCRAVVLWMSGLTWDILDQMPVIDALRSSGTAITALEPLPITGPQPQARQMVSGQNPGRSGYFDAWLPRQYVAQSVNDPETSLLHETITAADLTDAWIDLVPAEVPVYLSTQAPSADCLVIRTAAGDDFMVIEKAIEAAWSWSGTDGAFFLLSDHQAATVNCFVNINNALHALDVLEASAQQTMRWEETLAYHVGHGQLWINLAGREPMGIVAPGDEYTQTCQALIHSLSTRVLDPQSGEPVVERVYSRDEIYRGDYLFRAPDLIAVLRPGYAPSPNSILPGLDGAAVWPAPAGTRAVSGLHPMAVAGLAFAAGAPIAPGKEVAQSLLINVAPTILHALRLPIPADIDGEVIVDLFAPAFMQQHPIQRADPDAHLSSEDEQEVLARLKSLGYLG